MKKEFLKQPLREGLQNRETGPKAECRNLPKVASKERSWDLDPTLTSSTQMRSTYCESAT